MLNWLKLNIEEYNGDITITNAGFKEWYFMNEKILDDILARIDGKGYKAYKDFTGTYKIKNFTLFIDYVQGDPFASPSRIRVRVDQKNAGFPESLFEGRPGRIGFEDFITRAVANSIKTNAKGNRGTGKSGLIAIQSCGQEMLERTSVVINKDFLEARLTIGLPASGRRVLARQAREMLLYELPRIVDRSLFYRSVDREKLRMHVETMEDQDFLRERLEGMGLVCFIANGSILPRESGISQRPMKGRGVIPFISPTSMEVEISLPNRGEVKGMGIKKGVTLIVGGGYHGKSTLLRAVERGVYNHIPGDGRELVATSFDAAKIRAEDGRSVEKVNISSFINNLPNGDDTVRFSTQNASGSTSQAANIIEALELGAGTLLLDEDTSATNFMIRDGRMQELVAKDKEPITPFIDRIRQLYDEKGVSTVLVVGGSGDYFEVADSVVMMDNYRPQDVTDRAREIAGKNKTARQKETAGPFGGITERRPIPPGRMDDRFKVKVKGINTILYGRDVIDLSFVEQLVDYSQTNAIADTLKFMQRYVDGEKTLKSILDKVMEDIQREGLDIISPYRGHPGELALPRKFETGAAINRLRSARFSQ